MTSASISVSKNQEVTLDLDIVSVDDTGTWKVCFPCNVPQSMQPHKMELEQILAKVFSNCSNPSSNLALARQLAINWCQQKGRELGIAIRFS